MIFKSSHGNIYYEMHGPENSLVVAFIHGIFADHKMFVKQTPEFKKQYRVLLWDMPGFGQSANRDKEFDFSIAAKCFIELLDELDIDRVVLVGVSLGGWVSQYIASKYPERILAVAVEGASPLHGDQKKTALGFKAYTLMVKLTPWFLLRYAFKKMMLNMSFDEDLKEYYENMIINLDKKKILQQVAGVGRSIKEGIADPIPQQVLITHGDKEMPMIRKTCSDWHKNNPMSEYFVIQDSGHGANTFKPEEYNKILHAFLAKVMP